MLGDLDTQQGWEPKGPVRRHYWQEFDSKEPPVMTSGPEMHGTQQNNAQRAQRVRSRKVQASRMQLIKPPGAEERKSQALDRQTPHIRRV